MQIKNRFNEKVIVDEEEDFTEIVKKDKSNLSGAKIEFYQFPSIRLISSIYLVNLSDNLQLELMRRDAFGHPHTRKLRDFGYLNRNENYGRQDYRP